MVIVHSLAMARRAVAAARQIGRPVVLLSASGAGSYAGVGWWRNLVARAAEPGECADILDCGAAPGRALEALRAGQKNLVLEAEARVWTDIADRARSCGGVLLPCPPPALDLAPWDVSNTAERRLADWLRGDSPARHPKAS